MTITVYKVDAIIEREGVNCEDRRSFECYGIRETIEQAIDCAIEGFAYESFEDACSGRVRSIDTFHISIWKVSTDGKEEPCGVMFIDGDEDKLKISYSTYAFDFFSLIGLNGPDPKSRLCTGHGDGFECYLELVRSALKFHDLNRPWAHQKDSEDE